MTTFRVDSLSISLKDRWKEEVFALKNISFEVEEGYIMGLLGGNGMGKTTLIRCITDAYREYSGSISLFESMNFKHSLSYIPDQFPFNQNKSAIEIGKLMKHLSPSWDAELFKFYLNRYGIDPEEKTKTLSLGMKQRLMVAIALSQHAKLLIMDEPTDGIDPFDREMILEDIKAYHFKEKSIVIISSHDTNMLDSMVDYVGYLDFGSLVYFNDIESLHDTGEAFLQSYKCENNLIQQFKEYPSVTYFVNAIQNKYMEDDQ